MLQYSRDVKKECSPRVVKPTSLTDDAKRLTRETRKKYIVVRDVVFVNFCDVAARPFSKICFIRVLRKFVDIRRKNTFSFDLILFAGIFKSDSKAADSTK